MSRLLLALILLAACSTSPAPLLADRVEHLLMVDVSACSPEDPAAMRCPLDLQWQDYVTSFEVYGDHPSGPVATTACLQVRELLTPGVPPLDSGGGCAMPILDIPDVLWLRATLPGDGAGFSEDLAGSILVHLAPGDTLDGLIYYVQRVHPEVL